MKSIHKNVLPAFCILLASCAAGPGPVAPEQQLEPAKGSPRAAKTERPQKPVSERTPVPPEAMYEVFAGEVAGQHEDYMAAAYHYLEAARRSNDPAIAERATQIALFAGSHDLAREAVARLLELSPASRRAHNTALTLALHRGDEALALRHMRELLSLAENRRAGWLRIAQMLARAPDQEFAFARMQELVDGHAQSPDAWFAFSQLASHYERLDQALAFADRALELKPGWTDALVWRGRLKLSNAEYESAADDLERALKRDAEASQARLHYAEALRRLDRYDEAQAVLADLPQEPALIETRASLAVEAENWDLAAKLYERLLKQPEYAEQARFFLGQIAEIQQQHDRALEWYSQVTGGGYRLDARIREAVVMANQGRLEQALQLLEDLKKEGAESALEAWLAEGRILADAGRVEEAFEAYGRGMQAMEDSSQLRYARALLAAEQSQVERAERDLRVLLEQDPDDAQALNALGYTLAEQTDRYQEALELIEKALSLSPNDAAIVDSMGWVHYRLGNHERALEHLRRALDLQFDAEIAAHLGEVLWVTGDREEARTIWERALKRRPENSEVVRETMERLTP